jgi:hypothetical protein
VPESGLVAITRDDHGRFQTCPYHFRVWHTAFPTRLNVVILVKINLKTQARAHVILFSTDLALSADQILQLYTLYPALSNRVQLPRRQTVLGLGGLHERAAHCGLEVLNAANLSLFMPALSQRLLRDFRAGCPDSGVRDLKAVFRGRRYAHEALKLLPHPPEPILLSNILLILLAVTALGRIHTPVTAPAAP